MLTLGTRLRAARERKGWSQTYICNKLGISNSAMSGYERDYREPDINTLRSLCELYEVSIDQIVEDDSTTPSKVVSQDKITIDKPSKKSDNSTYTAQNGNGFIDGLMGEFLDPGEMVYVPIVADVSCGDPLFTEDDILGYLPVASIMYHIADKSDYFAIRAKGDSMIEADIKDGSLVLIRKQPTVDNGDIAAVCVKNEKATIKRVHIDGGMVVLSPANADYGPQIYPVQDIRIVGKAVMVTKAL